jgi:hypothetical protein
MKEKIEKLIVEQTSYRQECFEMLQEVTKIISTNISKEEKDALRTSLFCLENEYNIRLGIISDLENLLS